jgi:glycosyltransferase involved in cell wall biosynthesis
MRGQAAKTLRVLHVIASMSPRHGGPTDALARMFPYLESNGVDSLVATTNDDLEDTLDVPLEKTVGFLGARAIFFENKFRRPRRLRDLAYSPGLLGWLRDNIKSFDVVHVHALFSIATWQTMRIAHEAGIPYLCRPLGVLGRWAMHGAWHKRAFLQMFELRWLNLASAIEYSSELERDEASILGLRPPAHVIPLGFEPVADAPDANDKFRSANRIPPSTPIILFLSRIDPKKGLERLIKACAQLHDQAFKLVIAGAGQPEYEREMRTLVESSGLSSRVIWTGFLSGEEKAAVLRAADLFVLPSYSESFGIALAEAMSSGCAVITTPEVPLAQLVKAHQAGWVVSGEPDELAGILRQALMDRVQTRLFGENAARVSRTVLSYESVAPLLAGLYRNTASS